MLNCYNNNKGIHETKYALTISLAVRPMCGDDIIKCIDYQPSSMTHVWESFSIHITATSLFSYILEECLELTFNLYSTQLTKSIFPDYCSSLSLFLPSLSEILHMATKLDSHGTRACNCQNGEQNRQQKAVFPPKKMPSPLSRPAHRLCECVQRRGAADRRTNRHTDTQTHRDTEVSHSFDKNALY